MTAEPRACFSFTRSLSASAHASARGWIGDCLRKMLMGDRIEQNGEETIAVLQSPGVENASYGLGLSGIFRANDVSLLRLYSPV